MHRHLTLDHCREKAASWWMRIYQWPDQGISQGTVRFLWWIGSGQLWHSWWLVDHGWGSVAAHFSYNCTMVASLLHFGRANLSILWTTAASIQPWWAKVQHQPRGIGYCNINQNSRKSHSELWIYLWPLDCIRPDWLTLPRVFSFEAPLNTTQL